MSKSIKIKAFTILIAWTVIFLHGVIPHHHEQDKSCNSKSLIHDMLSYNHNEQESISAGQPDHHERACHFSVILFQQLNYDGLLFNPEKKTEYIQVLIIESAVCEAGQIDFSEPETDNTSLRAPPVS